MCWLYGYWARFFFGWGPFFATTCRNVSDVIQFMCWRKCTSESRKSQCAKKMSLICRVTRQNSVFTNRNACHALGQMMKYWRKLLCFWSKYFTRFLTTLVVIVTLVTLVRNITLDMFLKFWRLSLTNNSSNWKNYWCLLNCFSFEFVFTGA